MIIGSCPYNDCDETLVTSISDKAPIFEKGKCPECGRVYWRFHSRIQPYCLTESEFNEKYELDEKSKTIKEKSINA